MSVIHRTLTMSNSQRGAMVNAACGCFVHWTSSDKNVASPEVTCKRCLQIKKVKFLTTSSKGKKIE